MKLLYFLIFTVMAALMFGCAASKKYDPVKAEKANGAAAETAADTAAETATAEGKPALAKEAAEPAAGVAMDQSKAAYKEMAAAPPVETESMADSEEMHEEVTEARSRAVKPEPTVRYLSADDSNSQASPVIARKMIMEGRYVQPAVIRTYEFLNYYTFSYSPPADRPLRIVPKMRKLEKDYEYSLQIALRSRDRSLNELPPFNVTLLLDISGSMAGEAADLALLLIRRLVERMHTGDILSLVTCNRRAELLLDSHVAGPGTGKMLDDLLGGIIVNDITDLEKGVLLAYEVAGKNYNYRYLNRVILISDGADNTGKAAVAMITRYAEDSDRQGIYLAGIGLGSGFNDQLMDTFTDKGRGAYLFIDSESEIERILEESNFIANFDLAVKNVRLKMVMPPGWQLEEFHGEQISAKAADIVPQYLAPNDQMIYHMTISRKEEDSTEEGNSVRQDQKQEAPFIFEAEYTPLGGAKDILRLEASVSDMLAGQRQILKGDAVVEYAELLKEIHTPLTENKEKNLRVFDKAAGNIREINKEINDPELSDILTMLAKYRKTVEYGERFPGSRDRNSDRPDAVLGISANSFRGFSYTGSHKKKAIRVLERLGQSSRLVPQEGYRFLALSTGPIWNPVPAGRGELSSHGKKDPLPEYMGQVKIRAAKNAKKQVFDLHQIKLQLKAPHNARSFSFDFNFFSAEYPDYVNQDFNDSFYAILEAPSTNKGRTTNIAFDADNASIEVDNNYFQKPFHPIPNTGTGFDYHGSTGWLRTSWPIKGGELFTLTFSIHDEGDAIYDSLVVLDNFRFHNYEAVGTTDPLN
jgi:Ca-activated chloride channel family protein